MFPWAASGRAIANGRDEGFTKLIFDADTHRILGGGIVAPTPANQRSGPGRGNGRDVIDIAKTIHPHPAGESVGMARWPKACTDLPPMKKKSGRGLSGNPARR